MRMYQRNIFMKSLLKYYQLPKCISNSILINKIKQILHPVVH